MHRSEISTALKGPCKRHYNISLFQALLLSEMNDIVIIPQCLIITVLLQTKLTVSHTQDFQLPFKLRPSQIFGVHQSSCYKCLIVLTYIKLNVFLYLLMGKSNEYNQEVMVHDIHHYHDEPFN